MATSEGNNPEWFKRFKCIIILQMVQMNYNITDALNGSNALSSFESNASSTFDTNLSPTPDPHTPIRNSNSLPTLDLNISPIPDQFSLLLLLEYSSKSPAFLSWIGKINMIDDSYKGQYYKEENQLDSDVVKEQRKLKKQIGFNDELLTDVSESKDNDDEKKEQRNNININQYDNNNLGDDVIEPIEIHGLRKVYRGSYKRPPTVAVQDLWYSFR